MHISSNLRRCFAFIIDNFIAFSIGGCVLSLLKLFGINISPTYVFLKIMGGDTYIFLASLVFSFIVFFTYEFFFNLSKFSATPGKIILGIEVLYENDITIFNVLIRAIVKTSFVVFKLTIILIIVAIFSSKNKSIHDFLGRTLVVLKNKSITKGNRKTSISSGTNIGIAFLVLAIISYIWFFNVFSSDFEKLSTAMVKMQNISIKYRNNPIELESKIKELVKLETAN